ncbi:hypothetical protein GCM10010182_59750 [Actinomadura cremea]|nr:hypothetical protein GCM10010182_59750 [Actinomadura cremea]
MEQHVRRTGDHGIGRMVHVVHMCDDARELRRFYENVFGGVAFMGADEPDYLPWEDRYATLLMVGDLCIETMAPRMPADAHFPVGRFYQRFGSHLHSVGYKVDDLAGLADRLLKGGVYIGRPGGGRMDEFDPETQYFFPSPRDTAGLLLELCRHDMPGDPRTTDAWSSLARTWRDHPLGIERFACVTLGVRDLGSAVETYAGLMQAEPGRTGIDEDLKARFTAMRLGDCLLQLAEPLDDRSDLGRHVRRYGDMIYSLRFTVADLGAAETWLAKNDVRTTRTGAGLLATRVEDTYGAPIFFGTADLV